MRLYVAIVEFDDEAQNVVIGCSITAEGAIKICRQNMTDNKDKPGDWEEPGIHSRISGEFWELDTQTQEGQRIRYYVRPFNMTMDQAVSSVVGHVLLTIAHEQRIRADQ